MRRKKLLLGIAVVTILFGVGGSIISCEAADTSEEINENENTEGGTETGSDIEVPSDSIVEKKLEIVEEPEKTVFTINDTFTLNGLVVDKVEITNGEESFRETVSPSDYDLSIQTGTKLTEITDDLEVTLSLLSDTEKEYGSLVLHFIVEDYDRVTVTFKNDDGTELYVSSGVIVGTTTTYEGKTPSKVSEDDEFSYRFDGWYVEGDSSKTIIDLDTYIFNEDTVLIASFTEVDLGGEYNGFSYVATGDLQGYIITAYSGSDLDVIIPDTFQGLPIVGIDNGAVGSNGQGVFYNKDTIRSITLGENIKYVGDATFRGMDYEGLVITLNEGLEELGDYCFNTNKGITSITIPGTVKDIPAYCFRATTNLTSITLEEGIETIQEDTFYNSSITSLTLPNSLKSLGEDAFTNLKTLESIDLGSGYDGTGIENSKLFSYSGSILEEVIVGEDNPYLKTDDGYTLLSKDGKTLYGVARYGGNANSSSTYYIPETVEIIADNAFNYFIQGGWELVVFGDNVKEVGDYAFYYNNNSTSGSNYGNANLEVQFNDNLEIIHSYAFYYFFRTNNSVEELTLPDSVTTVEERAFSGCTNLVSFTFGASQQYFGDNIFAGCTKLSSINISSSNNYLSVDGNIVLNKAQTSIVYYLENETEDTSYVMPDTVTRIEDGVFANNSILKSITLSSNIEYIGAQAFSSSSLACNIVFPASLKYIGDSAFLNSSSLTGIEYNCDVYYLGTTAFKNVSKATFSGDLTITEGTTIGTNIFEGCSLLSYITVETDLTDSLFYDCCGLEKVAVKDDITTIPDNCFYNCSSLTSLELPSTITSIGDSSFSGTSSLESIEIPINLVSLGDEAFEESGIITAVLPSTLLELGSNVFYNASKLETIVFNNDITEISSSFLYGTDSLKSITWPKNIETIGSNAFSNSGITSIVIPSTVTSIGEKAFYSSSLTSIIIPSTVTTLGDEVFRGCSDLVSATINANIASLPMGTFRDCTSLKSVTLSNTINDIYYQVFLGSGIEEFILGTNMTLSGYQNFYDATSLKKIYWNSLVQSSIPDYTFYGTTSLEGIELGESVTITSIGQYSFYSSGIKEEPFDLSGVTTIGARAFQNCSNLEIITLPTNSFYTEISQRLLQSCSSLQNLVIPDNVTAIGSYAFTGCTSLGEITFENSEVSVSGSGSSAILYGCSNLNLVNFNGTVEEALEFFGTNIFGSYSSQTREITIKCNDGSLLYNENDKGSLTVL